MGLDALFCTWRYFCRCHMEESEQQAAGLSALADPAPVVSLGTMPGQDFSTLPWANGKEKDIPLGNTLSQEPVYQTITVLYQARGEGPLTWQREVVFLTERDNNNPFWVSCWRRIAFHFEVDYSREKVAMWAFSIQGWGSSAATTEWEQEVFTELRCHLPWHGNTQSRRRGWSQVRLVRDQNLLHWDLLHLNNYGNKSCSLHISTPSRVLKGHMWFPCCILIIWPFKKQLYFLHCIQQINSHYSS